MNDLFYYFSWVFVLTTIKDIVFFNKDFEESYSYIKKYREQFVFSKKLFGEMKQMELGELSDARTKLDGMINNGVNDLDKIVKPNSFSNIMLVVYIVWNIFGLVISNLWAWFALNLIIIIFVSLYPVFFNSEKRFVFVISLLSLIIRILIVGLIEYLHFN